MIIFIRVKIHRRVRFRNDDPLNQLRLFPYLNPSILNVFFLINIHLKFSLFKFVTYYIFIVYYLLIDDCIISTLANPTRIKVINDVTLPKCV